MGRAVDCEGAAKREGTAECERMQRSVNGRLRAGRQRSGSESSGPWKPWSSP